MRCKKTLLAPAVRRLRRWKRRVRMFALVGGTTRASTSARRFYGVKVCRNIAYESFS